jgi:hypothetical protein
MFPTAYEFVAAGIAKSATGAAKNHFAHVLLHGGSQNSFL